MASLLETLEWWCIAAVNGATPPSCSYPPDPPPTLTAKEEAPVLPPSAFLAGERLALVGDYPVRDPELSQVLLQLEDFGYPVCISGASGSGKSTFTKGLIAWLAQTGASLVVLDPYRDGAEGCLELLQSQGVAAERVHFWDLGNSRVVVPFNFLSAPLTDSYRVVEPLIEHVVQEADHIGVPTLDALRCSVVALKEARASLLELSPLLLNTAYRQQVLEQVRDEYTRDFFLGRFEAMSADKRFNNLVLPIMNKFSPLLANGALRRSVGSGGMLDLPRLVNTPGQILVVALDVNKTRSAGYLVGRILIAEMERAILGRADLKDKNYTPVRLVIDEFAPLAGPAFHTLVSQGRRFKLGTLVTYQNQSQLDTPTRELIRNNAHLRGVFQCGPYDASELAPELRTLARESARNVLLSLKPGQAVLIKSSQGPVKVKVPLPPASTVSVEAAEAYRHEARLRLGRPSSEIDDEIAMRHALIADLGETRQEPEVREVRHGKLPNVL